MLREVVIFDGMTHISGQMLQDLLPSADNRATMYGEKPKPSVARMMACMGTSGQAFIDSVVEIARAVHRTMHSLGYEIGPETSTDISNVRSTLTTVKPEHVPKGRNKGKLFPVTDRSDPQLLARPDEGEQGFTASFPINGPLPMITHQGSTQLVYISVY